MIRRVKGEGRPHSTPPRERGGSYLPPLHGGIRGGSGLRPSPFQGGGGRRVPRVSVIIPAFNEQEGIVSVLRDIPKGLVSEVLVVDNASTDRTAQLAAQAGARVVREARRGYGSACLAGIAAADGPDILVFLDGDHSDHPDEMPLLLGPILRGEADLVIGSRTLGRREAGALLPQARFGNWLTTRLIRLLFGARFTDVGPFRAVRRDALEQMDMRDRTFGWTVEMQVKAARLGLRTTEVPVSYRRRKGVSKITGTMGGTVRAGYKILYTIFRQWWWGGGP